MTLHLSRTAPPYTDMECVVDDYPKRAHEEQDEDIRLLFPPLTPQNFNLLSPLVLAFIVKLSGGRLHSNYLNVSECEIIIKEEPRLRSMLLDGSNHGYKPVRLLSKDLAISSDCTSDPPLYPIVELLQPPSEYQFQISWQNVEILKVLFQV